MSVTSPEYALRESESLRSGAGPICVHCTPLDARSLSICPWCPTRVLRETGSDLHLLDVFDPLQPQALAYVAGLIYVVTQEFLLTLLASVFNIHPLPCIRLKRILLVNKSGHILSKQVLSEDNADSQPCDTHSHKNALKVLRHLIPLRSNVGVSELQADCVAVWDSRQHFVMAWFVHILGSP